MSKKVSMFTAMKSCEQYDLFKVTKGEVKPLGYYSEEGDGMWAFYTYPPEMETADERFNLDFQEPELLDTAEMYQRFKGLLEEGLKAKKISSVTSETEDGLYVDK